MAASRHGNTPETSRPNQSHLDRLPHTPLPWTRTARLLEETYLLPAGGQDAQHPHSADEVYIIERGRLQLEVEGETIDVGRQAPSSPSTAAGTTTSSTSPRIWPSWKSSRSALHDPGSLMGLVSASPGLSTGRTGTIWCKPPDSTMSPRRRPRSLRTQLVGQPGHAARRMTECCCPGAAIDRHAVAVEEHPDQAQVKSSDGPPRAACRTASWAAEALSATELTSFSTASPRCGCPYLDGRQYTVDGGGAPAPYSAPGVRIGRCPAGAPILGLGPGLDELVIADLIALLNDHVIEQDARDGFGDPEQLLHGQRSEARFVAADDPPGRQPVFPQVLQAGTGVALLR